MIAAILLLAATTGAVRPQVRIAPSLQMNPADLEPLIHKVASQGAVAVDVTGGDFIGVLAVVYGKPKRSSARVCRGTAAYYAMTEPGKWTRAPDDWDGGPVSHAVISRVPACTAAGTQTRILLQSKFNDDDVVGIDSAIHSGRIAKDRPAALPPLELGRDNRIESIQRIDDDRATAITSAPDGQEEHVLLIRSAKQWFVFDAGEHVAWGLR